MATYRVRELHHRWKLCEACSEYPRVARSSADVLGAIPVDWRDGSQETFGLVMLNVRMRILGVAMVTRGTSTSCQMSTAATFRLALLGGASAIVLVHNHPSGDPTPSDEDVAITAQFVAAGKVLEVSVVDHLIVTAEGKHVSLRDTGRM